MRFRRRLPNANVSGFGRAAFLLGALGSTISSLAVGCTGQTEPALGRAQATATSGGLSASVVAAANGSPIAGLDPLTSGAVIDLSRVPTRDLSIVAKDSSAASVQFVLDGSYSHLENVVPFSLCGDQTTSYTPCTALDNVGSHRLQVTSYSGSQAGGSVLGNLDISFDVTQSSSSQVQTTPSDSGITFTLINAQNAAPISGFDPIPNGATFNPSALPSGLSIRANVPSSVASVLFAVDSSYTHGETIQPLSLCGDQTTSYTPCSVLTTPGAHRLTLTPYSQSQQSGTAGSPVTLDFTVQSSTSQATAPSITSQPQSTSVSAGQSAVFSVGASGTAPLAFQWQKNGTTIAGATSASYTTPATTSSDDGALFSVVVSNSAGSVTSNGARLSVTAGTNSSTAAFPLKMSADRKYLVDQSNVPFLMIGDSPWSLPSQPPDTDITTYLDDRKSRGFNTILIEAMEHKFTTRSPHWMNANGQVPFANNNDFTTVNTAFFDHLAWLIQQAANRGILVLLTPSYLGYNCADEGWCQEMFANGTQKLNQYGQFLGSRLKSLPNIVWVDGGDHVPSTSGSPSEWDLVNAIATGVETGDGGTHLHTAHWGRGTSSSEGPIASWLDIDATYTGSGLQTWQDSLSDWSRDKGVRPSFLIEALYEFSSGGYGSGTGAVVRAQMYQPILAGSFGFLFGNVPIWFSGNVGDGNPGWSSGTYTSVGSWKTEFGSPGADYATHVKQLLVPLPWQALAPDTSHVILQSGYADSDPNHNVMLASTPDGHLAVAYFTATMTVTIDMSRFAGSVQASFFDPTSGATQGVSGSPFANSGTRSFAAPGKNAAGDADWVLVLQAN